MYWDDVVSANVCLMYRFVMVLTINRFLIAILSEKVRKRQSLQKEKGPLRKQDERLNKTNYVKIGYLIYPHLYSSN